MDRREFQERYRDTAKELVMEGFPELKNSKIVFIYFPKYLWATGFSLKLFNLIILGFTDRALKYDLSNDALRGLLAHELGHMARFTQMNLLSKIKLLGYYFSRNIYSKEETDTDKYIVRRGYARERYALAVWSCKNKSAKETKKRRQRGHMSPEEIKSYAKKIGKW